MASATTRLGARDVRTSKTEAEVILRVSELIDSVVPRVRFAPIDFETM